MPPRRHQEKSVCTLSPTTSFRAVEPQKPKAGFLDKILHLFQKPKCVPVKAYEDIITNKLVKLGLNEREKLEKLHCILETYHPSIISQEDGRMIQFFGNRDSTDITIYGKDYNCISHFNISKKTDYMLDNSFSNNTDEEYILKKFNESADEIIEYMDNLKSHYSVNLNNTILDKPLYHKSGQIDLEKVIVNAPVYNDTSQIQIIDSRINAKICGAKHDAILISRSVVNSPVTGAELVRIKNSTLLTKNGKLPEISAERKVILEDVYVINSPKTKFMLPPNTKLKGKLEFQNPAVISGYNLDTKDCKIINGVFEN